MLINVDASEAKAIITKCGADSPELRGKVEKSLKHFRENDLRSKRDQAYVVTLAFIEANSGTDFAVEYGRILGIIERGERVPE